MLASLEHRANELRVGVYSVYAVAVVAAVALHEDDVLGPVRVLVHAAIRRLEGLKVPALWVEDRTAAHDVGLAREDLGQTAHDDVGELKHVHVGKGANGLVDYNGKVEFVGERADLAQVRAHEERVSGELAEQREDLFPAAKQGLELVEVRVGREAEEEAARAELLQNLECVDVGEAETHALFGAAAVEECAVCVEDGIHAA